MTINQALIMAAGHAKRMRPLTDTLPKPLLKVGEQPLLTHIIGHLIAADVTRIVINGYHAIAPLKRYIEDIQNAYPDIDFILSEETALLETGGGAVQGLDYLDTAAPFYMINGDAFWINPKGGNSLKNLEKQWEQDKDCDLLLLLQPTASMTLTNAVGDYNINNNKAIRAKDQSGSYMFTGIRICAPHILKGYAIEAFSFLTIMDECEKSGTLHGHVHKGAWYNLNSAEELNDVNEALYGIVA